MGLLRAAASAIGSTMHDQWKDIISCGNMDNDTLMISKTSDTGTITRKSVIRVSPGQCAVIVQNGKALDATAEEGDFIFDESASPSFFAGNFGAVFKEMWQRFTFNGTTINKQSVFFINIKEILDNKFGTGKAIPFKDWTCPIPNQMTGRLTALPVMASCYGTYSFKIVDPALFLREIAGTATVYKKQQLVEQMKSEVLATLSNVLNEIGRVNKGEESVGVYDLPSQTDEIRKMMDEMVFDEPIRARGIGIKSFNIISVTPDDASIEKIDKYNLSSNANLQQGTMVEAYAEAVKGAANNANGAATGFMNIGMMNMTSGGMFGNTMNNVATQAAQNTQAVQAAQNVVNASQNISNTSAQQPQSAEQDGWTCPQCGKTNTGKFCAECGAKKPEVTGKFCPECGAKVDENTKFCPECGTKLQ